MKVSEQVLSVIPGTTEHQRLVIVQRCMETRDAVHLYRPEQPFGLQQSPSSEQPDSAVDGAEMHELVSLSLSARPFCQQIQSIRERPIVLRQESFSPAVGWFTQSEMELTAGQWSALKLTILPGQPTCAPAFGPSQRRPRPATSIPHQRILSATGEVISLAIHCDQAVPA